MARSRLLIDTGPLRTIPDFRRFWGGFLVSIVGTQLTVVAVPYQVFELTHSSLDVGLVSLAQLVPLLLVSLAGGGIVDGVNRRRLLMVTQLLLASTSLGLALNASIPHPALWAVFVLSAAAAAVSGIDTPTRNSLVADLVERDALLSAVALWQVVFQVGGVVGPAVAGVLLAQAGLSAVYLLDVATFAASLLGLLRVTALRSVPSGERARARLSPTAFLGGLRYLRGRQEIQGAYLIDLNAMIFGMPRALFPALGLERFHGGAGTVGLLYAAPGAGALIGALLTGWVSVVRRRGLAVLAAVGVWGGAIAVFGLVPNLPLALVLLGVAGAADVVSAVFRSTIIQSEAPVELRGRLQSVQTAVVTGGPRLGDFESGAVAAAFGTVFSVVSGGIACLIGVGIVAKAMPRFAAQVSGGEAEGGSSTPPAVDDGRAIDLGGDLHDNDMGG